MTLWRLIATLVVSLAIAGCGSDSGFNEETDFLRKEGAVQFVNMMSDSPELTMIHGLQNQTIRFPFTSGGEVRFEDRYDWRLAYRDSNLEEITVAQGENQQILEDRLSTFLFMGSLTTPKIEIVEVALPPFADRTEGAAVIWFAANLTSVSMVDLYLLDSESSLNSTTPIASLDSQGFTNEITVDSGDGIRLIVTVAGSLEVLFESGPISLSDRSVDLFALVDDFGPDSLNHVDVIWSSSANGSIMPDFSQATLIRNSNFASSNELLVTISDTTFSSSSRGDRSDYAETNPGEQTITVSRVEDTLFDDTANLFAGGYHSFLIFDGPDTETPLTPFLVRDEFRSITDRVYFQFINGSDEAIDFYALINGQDTDDTAPVLNDAQALASGLTEVPSGDTRFVVQTSDNSETLESVQVVLQEGITYTAVYEARSGLQIFED